jgi:hypothetical protein
MWDTIGSIGTAVAVLVAAFELRRNTRQATTDFEDDLSREYRELARGIPVRVILGGGVSEQEFQEAFPRLFQYIDLSNEQVFLRMTGRVSKNTWEQWRDGIQMNLQSAAVARAW